MENDTIHQAVLIDDDPINNLLCSSQIKKFCDYIQLTIFEDPAEALDYFKTTSLLPEVILLDINMPVMNGWQLLDELNKLSITLPPVFMVSSSSSKNEQEKITGYSQIKSFIEKPLDKQKLELIFG